MEKYIPKVKMKQNKYRRPSWLDKKTLRNIQWKHKLYKRFLNTKAGIDYSNNIKSRNECNTIVKNAKCIYEKFLARNSKTNPKMFWKYVNEKLKSEFDISPLQIDTDIVITDEDKDNTVNKFFVSVYTGENLDNVPKFEPSSMSNSVTLADMHHCL